MLCRNWDAVRHSSCNHCSEKKLGLIRAESGHLIVKNENGDTHQFRKDKVRGNIR